VNKSKIATALASDFYSFFCEFWDVVNTNDYIPAPHIKVLSNEVTKLYNAYIQGRAYDLNITVPPGTSKSTIFSVMLPAWLWVRNPLLSILSSSYAQQLTNNLTIKTRDIIESEKFKYYFPHIQLRADRNQITTYQNKNGGLRFGASVGSALTGFHFDFMILDDPLSAHQAQSETYRTRATNYYFGTMRSRKIDKQNTPTIRQ